MNSLPSLIINTRNHNKRASLAAMPAQSNSLIKSVPFVSDYYIKLSTSTHCSMFDEQINCVNRQYMRRKADGHHQYRRSVVVTNTSSNFRSTLFTNNYHQEMKRHQPRMDVPNLLASKERMMIGLTQSQEHTPLSIPSVNHHLPTSTIVSGRTGTANSTSSIYDNQLHQKRFSQIRLGLRSSATLDDKQQQLFDQIFPTNEPTTNVSESILDQCLLRVTDSSCNIFLILSGSYKEVHPLQTTVILSSLRRLWDFVNQTPDKDLLLRLSVQELSNNPISNTTAFLFSTDGLVSSPYETSEYLNQLCSEHRYQPLLITFHLLTRSSNDQYALFHILLTNENESETTKEQFPHLLMSLALAFSSNRQKQSLYPSKKRSLSTRPSLSSIFREFLLRNCEQDLLYIFANVRSLKQVRYWSKIQRLFRVKRNRLKMSRDSQGGSSSFETSHKHTKEEIWIDGPLSASNHKREVWIDGPPSLLPYSPKRSTPKHRSTSQRQSTNSRTKPSILSSGLSHSRNEEMSLQNFDTESIISSHCHLPVLPVFKDHSLLPFRSNQTLPRVKPIEPSPLNLRLSTNKLNDDMEMLEKTLETLLVPSPIVPSGDAQQSSRNFSLDRIEHLSSLMSNDEKSKRLSRIVSPTRFDKLLPSHHQSSENTSWFRSPSPSSAGSSVPNSPLLNSRTRQSRTLLDSTPNTPLSSLQITPKKCSSRPSIFQRLFGSRSSSIPQQPVPITLESPPSSPLSSPLTVTLDSHDDLMPLTTSSTASSASGRASSSGYESMSNTILEEMIASKPVLTPNVIKLRSKSLRKDERRSNTNISWNSPTLRDKSHRQQHITQLKHRQNELKLELAMTKTFLLMDKNKTIEQNDSLNSTISNSPMHIILPNGNEEEELEREIEHLERRLTSAKSQLMLITYQKTQQPFKS